nr:O-antigen ligase family protein [Lachnospiraceae bacterium]
GYTYWNMGLITQIALVIIYLLVSRFWSGKKWEWYIWLVATWIVAAIGVLNRLGQDPLGTLAEKDNPQLIQFLSTIGQQTYFSNYVTVFIALGFFVYWKGREIDVKIISGIYILVVAMSLTASGNDSGFLAIFAALSILFWFSFRDNESMNAFFEIAIIVLLGFKLLGLMQITNENATALGGLSQRLTQGNETLAGLILFVILYAGLRYLEKNKDLDVSKYSVIRKIYLGLVIGAFVLYLIYGVLNTAKLLPASLSITGEGTQTTYFTFGDNWGNHRGAIWHIAVMTMGDWLSKDPLRFFFGAGPDCVIYELSAYHQEEILNNVGTELGIACVHNEWLNCLLGYGILGGASYIAIFVYAIKRALKNIEENLGVLMCVVAYMVHNFFCYQNIIVTPMIFVMIGCIEAGAHRAEAAAASASDQK